MSTGGVRQLVRWSLWHDALQYIAQDWQRIVGPGLRVVIHPDSQLGDESNMLRKARGAIIDAVGLSSVGLSRIESGVSPFRVPMMLESYEELDFVRERMAADPERRIEFTASRCCPTRSSCWPWSCSSHTCPR